MGPFGGCADIQNRENTCIRFSSDKAPSTLAELDDHLRDSEFLNELLHGGAGLLLKLHCLSTQRERQADDDDGGQDISGTVNAFPHGAGREQDTVAAFFKLGDGIFVASAHLDERVLGDLLGDDVIDSIQSFIGSEEDCGMTVSRPDELDDSK